ncbi:MAG: hypothetical protein QM642_10385 [Edaphocola sp.]
MKRIILSTMLLAGAATAANAQAGSVLVYGTLGYRSAKTADDNKTRSFNINPGIGYQFDKNWTVGVAGGWGTSRYRLAGSSDWDFTNTYNAGVFVRHTLPIGKLFYVFHQLEAGYRGTNYGSTGTNVTTNANGFYASLTPVIGINIVHGIALNFGFGGIEYQTLKYKGAENASSSFGVTWGSQFNVGVSRNLFCGHGKPMLRKRRGGRGPGLNNGSRPSRKEIMDDSKEDNQD